MKIKDLTTKDVANYLKVDDIEDSVISAEIEMIMESTEAMIRKRTGRTREYIDEQDDLCYPFLALCAEQFENRQLRLDKGQYKNDLIYDLIDAHNINLIPDEVDIYEEALKESDADA
jgi:hypothetical protein